MIWRLAPGSGTFSIVSDTVSFAITTQWSGTDVVLAVVGELDLSAAAAWDASVDEALGQMPSQITIDLGGTTFVDSSGLRLLLTLRQTTGEREIAFRIANISHAVARLLEVTGLTDLVGNSSDATLTPDPR